MSQPNRLPEGGRIDRAKTIGFWYDERKYEGHPGDTLAAALLANGVTLVGRSFKYHRPRGIFSAGAEEPNALVQLERGAFTEPNRRATEIEIYDGLVARSQNCWPSVRFDLGAISSLLSRILPAGFYYKTFMHPRALWMTYEKYIRKAAGLGRAPREIDPYAYDKTHAHCDVLVIGAGPAGLQAACAAGATGARVIVADERSEFGGQLLGERARIDGDDAEEWIAARVKQLGRMSQVTMLARTTVTGCYDYNFAVANERVSEHLGPSKGDSAPKERLWKIRAKQIVVASGSIERPLVFADNDRPGVMLASAMRAYLNRFGVLAAKRIAVLTNNDSAYRTALDADRAGAAVEVIDVRAAPVGELVKQARDAGIRIHFDSAISAVHYARGRIAAVTVMALSADGDAVRGDGQALACDAIAVSGGWTPTVHLLSQAKIDLAYNGDDGLHCFLPAADADDAGAPLPNPRGSNSMFCAGACRGAQYLDECLTQGRDAGVQAAAAAGFSGDADAPPPAAPRTDEPRYGPMRALWILPCDHPIGRGPKKHFHELHNDSTIADIALAAREGFDAVEHLKRYTTTGMGTDQGKTSNLNALAALAAERGGNSVANSGVGALGATTFRPPYTPLTFGSIVGHERRDLFLQQRTTPMHPWHDRRGAVYEDVGDWKRPRYFPSGREDMHAAVQRECLAARNAVGILDASTLGKIDIQGEDAGALLDMIYTNAWRKLAVGACRYGLMLNEHGMVFDDGVTTRLGENHYHMTTTTGGAARVMNWLEEWLQTEWPHLKVYCTSVTEQWAVASINGPNSRALLAELCDRPAEQLNRESFPFMTMQRMQVAGIPARVFRISFTGELAFEINVPARYGLALWRALMRAGERHGICPYGTEAMHVLRAEKGFIIVGQDTDGTVTPADLGMDWIVSKRKDDFIGKRSLSRSDTARGGRKQLVGLLAEDPNRVLPEGAHAVVERRRPPMEMIGHISSSYMSPALGRSIALGLIADGLRRKGERIEIALDGGSTHRATIVDSAFFDPSGERARG